MRRRKICRHGRSMRRNKILRCGSGNQSKGKSSMKSKSKKKGFFNATTAVILGIGVAAAAGAFWLVTRKGEFSGGHPDDFPPDDTGTDNPLSPVTNSTPPDVHGPRVTKGKSASTETTITTPKKYPGMVYARIKKTDGRYHVFTPPVNGIFTRRLLSVKGKLWAEILPA